MFDCIIVGAGPAGATAAYHLAKSGKSVLVIEKEPLPRRKACGGGISPAIAKWFDFDFSPVIDNTVNSVKYTWKMDDPVYADLEYVEPMWMVKRDLFDNFLIEQAQKQGTEVKDHTEVIGIKFENNAWQIATTNGTFAASYLIAADGANGPMANWLGFQSGNKVIAATLEVETAVPADQKNLACFDFGSLKNGFLWSFPKANGYSISGAFIRGKGKAKELQEQIHKYASFLGANPTSGQYTQYTLNVWKESQPMHTKNAVIAGEAAGMVDPLIAEGIRPAIFTGLQAAAAIVGALNGDNNALANYTQTISEQWESDLALANRLSGLFYQFPKIAYKVGVKRPAAAQLMGQILTGELRYSDVTEKAMKRLKGSLIPGMGG